LDLLAFPTRRSSDLARQLCFSHGAEEVALVLAGVAPLEQAGVARDFAGADVVSRGDMRRPECRGVVEEGLELDFAVAQDVRIRRSEEHTSELQSREN